MIFTVIQLFIFWDLDFFILISYYIFLETVILQILKVSPVSLCILF